MSKSNILKICHTADLHIVLRDRHLIKTVGFRSMLDNMANKFIEAKPDYVLMVGDLFHKYDVTNDENNMMVEFIYKLLDADLTVIYTLGNHEIKQRTNEFDIGDGSLENYTDPLQVLYNSIRHENLHYLNRTALYDFGDVVFANWHHGVKYSINDEPLNPWLNNERIEGKFHIDTFHDPVKDCIGWDSTTLKGDNERRISTNEFKGDLALFGDIHIPTIFENSNKTLCTYPSSPFVENFGEGDYYTNDKNTRQSNNRHGYNYIEIDTLNNKVLKLEFTELKQYFGYHTIELNEDMTLDKANNFKFVFDDCKRHFIKIVSKAVGCKGEIIDSLVQNLKTNYSIQEIEVKDDANSLVEVNLLDGVDNTEQLFDREFILSQALEFFESKINKKTVPDDELRQRMLDFFTSIFDEQLDKLDLDIKHNKTKLLKIDIDHFLSLGKTSFEFDRNDNLVRIKGTNGVGKTTLYKMVKWLTNRQIDARQDVSKSKINNLDYFNDKVPHDEVYGSLEFLLNNEEKYKIERTLKRVWKRGKNMSHDSKWRSFVSKVEETFTIYDDNGVELDNIHAQKLLDECFGTYDEFNSMHFVDKGLLDNIISLSTNNMIDFILKHLGITFFKELGNGLTEIKEKHLDTLNKPNIDLVTASENVALAKNKLLDFLNNFDNIDEKIKESKDNTNKISNDIIKLVGTKKPVDDKLADLTDSIIESDINTKQKSLDTLYESINRIKTDWNAVKDRFDVVKQKITENDINISNKDKNTKVLTDKIDLIEQSIKSANSKKNSIYKEHENDVNSRISKLENTISVNKNNILELKGAISTFKTEFTDRHNKQNMIEINNVEVEISKINTNVVKISNECTKFETLINTKTTEIKTLQDSKNCPTCKRTYDDVTEKNNSIDVLDSEIKGLLSKLDKYRVGLTKLETLKATNTRKLSELKKEIKTVDMFNDDDFKHSDFFVGTTIDIESLESANKLNKETIEIIRLELTNFNDDIILSVGKIDESITAKWDEINKLKTEINEIDEKFLGFENDNINLNSELNEIIKKKKAFDLDSVDNMERVQNVNSALDKAKNNKILFSEYKINKVFNDSIDLDIERMNKELRLSSKKTNELIELSATSIKTKVELEQQLKYDEKVLYDVKEYDIIKTCVNVYRNCVGKKGLPAILFNKIAVSINNELNDILQDFDFRIIFDLQDKCTLKMVDLTGRNSLRPVYLISGMETTVSALALIYMIKLRKIKHNTKLMMIDEISATLNDGKDSNNGKSSNKNYRKLLMKIVKRISKTEKVLMVDHVINEGFDSEALVYKSDSGVSVIEQY